MSNFVDDVGVDQLAAHLTAAIRHASTDHVPAGQVTLHEQLLFTLLRSALATPPRLGTSDYAQRLAFGPARGAARARNASPYPDDYAVAA